MGIASDIVYITFAAMIGGLLAHVCRLPLILGYIVAGAVISSNLAPVVTDQKSIELLAELGVGLLLFTLGLEFSFKELKRLALISFFATPLQIILSSISGYLIAVTLGIDRIEALWLGAACALSSTMVVLKTLASRDALHSRAGRKMIAMLIAQDLAIVPLMVLLPQITITSETTSIGVAITKSLLFLGLMYVGGTQFFPRAFSLVARWGSRELFSLLTLCIALGAGYIAHSFGLSFALGAFVAGMLLSETDFNHQAMSDVSGLRDLFSLLFFVSVGMLFRLDYVLENLGLIVTTTLLFVFMKSLIIVSLLRALSFPLGLAISVGLGISQIGEFSFLIMELGKSLSVIQPETQSLLISIAVFSMIVTPLLIALGSRCEQYFYHSDTREHRSLQLEEYLLKEHVIILGGGAIGEYIALSLKELELPYVIIEQDLKQVFHLRDQGLQVIFGDCSHYQILQAAKIDSARLALITVSDSALMERVISEIRELRAEIPVVARWDGLFQDAPSRATEVLQELVQPKREVGLEMIHQALRALGSSESQVFTVLGQLRSRDLGANSSQPQVQLIDATRFLTFTWLPPLRKEPPASMTIKASNFREQYGISIVAIMRGEEFIPSPHPDFLLSEGDSIGVLGSQKQIASVERALFSAHD